ncbi:MAG: Txe/YoeB family addiction module toxin [Holosporaceae bacterium]|nr:Txe/YoeB family addiction module toxin [Holosporaceae bacterium]
MVYTENFKKHFTHWLQNNRKIAEKILGLIKAIENDPLDGIGKPNPLAHALSGCWSRRINKEHRLVYRLKNDEVQLLVCHFHY